MNKIVDRMEMMIITGELMCLFEEGINVAICGVLGMWGQNQENLHSRNETHMLGIWEGCVTPF